MTVVEIVADWLKAHGYDGLYAEGECACLVDKLMPCDEGHCRCLAGYKTECGEDCGEHIFHIGPKKIEEPAR